MDLVPLTAETGGDAVLNAVRLSPEALALANVRVTRVTEDVPTKEITLHGIVRADERRIRVQVAHVKGRIERLFVHAPGERVREGDIIARVSSPDMHTARQELIEAHRAGSLHYPELIVAARERLRLWKLTEEQIRETERSGIASPIIDIPADVDGVVTARRIEEGDYVVPGTVLFELADLSHLRAVFNARESDIPYLRVGLPVDYTLTALPGRSFQGKISIVEPSLSENARVLEVRVEIPNPTGELRPGMYARATVRATLSSSPTHQVVIPSSAVLWTGPRSLVYVRQGAPDNPFFLPRSVELGPSLGDAYVVLSGLSPGEEIVSRGLFAIDASAQLEGKHSMMNDVSPTNTPLHTVHKTSSPSPSLPANSTPSPTISTLLVHGLCEMCRDRIESIALSAKGVLSASWDLSTHQLTLHLSSPTISLDAIASALASAGHDAGDHKAPLSTYNALPPCCKYRLTP